MNVKATLIAAAQAAGLFISGLFIHVLGLMLTPVPLVIAYVRHGRAEGLSALALAAAVVAAFAGWHVTAILVLVFGLMAVGTAEGMRGQWRPEFTALAGGLLPSAFLGLITTRYFLMKSRNPFSALETFLQVQRSEAAKIYTKLGLTEVANAVTSVPDTFIHYFVLLSPGIVVTLLVLVAAACHVLARIRLLKRPGAGPIPVWTPLSSWYAPDAWVWGLIITLIFSMLPNEPLKFTGFNLAIPYVVVYLTQGVAIVEHYLKKARIQSVIRGLIHAVLLALPPVVACIIALGLVDIWADFRKVRTPAQPE